MTTEELKINLKYKLKEYYKSVIATDDYIYVEGTIPIMLVAHMDTVYKEPPTNLYLDKKQNVIYSETGLGADDRAGIIAITIMLEKGYKPYILFCDEEEVGGLGATKAAKELPIPNVNVIVELDRAGSNDYVTYRCDNNELDKWVEKFGFVRAEGTFSDISFLCPQWGIAGVNLSIGYYNQHSKNEFLNLTEFFDIIQRVELILQSPPVEQLEYITASYKQLDGYETYGYTGGYDDAYGYDSILIELPVEELEELHPEINWNDLINKYGLEIEYIAKQGAINALLDLMKPLK